MQFLSALEARYVDHQVARPNRNHRAQLFARVFIDSVSPSHERCLKLSRDYFERGTRCKLGIRLSHEGDAYTTEDARVMQIKYNKLKECHECRRG